MEMTDELSQIMENIVRDEELRINEEIRSRKIRRRIKNVTISLLILGGIATTLILMSPENRLTLMGSFGTFTVFVGFISFILVNSNEMRPKGSFICLSIIGLGGFCVWYAFHSLT